MAGSPPFEWNTLILPPPGASVSRGTLSIVPCLVAGLIPMTWIESPRPFWPASRESLPSARKKKGVVGTPVKSDSAFVTFWIVKNVEPAATSGPRVIHAPQASDAIAIPHVEMIAMRRTTGRSFIYLLFETSTGSRSEDPPGSIEPLHSSMPSHPKRGQGPRRRSLQRKVQGRVLTGLIESRLDGFVVVDSEGDGAAGRAAGNPVGADHIDAEACEVVDPPRRRDTTPRRSDVRLDSRTGRAASVATVEDFAREADDRSDTAGGRVDREPGAEPCRPAVPGPWGRPTAVDDLVCTKVRVEGSPVERRPTSHRGAVIDRVSGRGRVTDRRSASCADDRHNRDEPSAQTRHGASRPPGRRRSCGRR